MVSASWKSVNGHVELQVYVHVAASFGMSSELWTKGTLPILFLELSHCQKMWFLNHWWTVSAQTSLQLSINEFYIALSQFNKFK